MADAYQASLDIDSALSFEKIAAVTHSAIDGRTFDGASVRHLRSLELTEIYLLGDGAHAPQVELAKLRSGAVGFSMDPDTVIVDENTSEGLLSGLVFMWKLRKLNKSMTPFPAVMAAVQAAIAQEDPAARFTLQS